MTARKRLGDILIERGLLNEQQLQLALEDQRTSGDKLGDILVRLGYITAEKMADALSVHLGYPRVDLARQYIARKLLNLFRISFSNPMMSYL